MKFAIGLLIIFVLLCNGITQNTVLNKVLILWNNYPSHLSIEVLLHSTKAVIYVALGSSLQVAFMGHSNF